MIGLLGGTFNPVHIGHVQAALTAADVLGVSTMCLVLAANPYHKPAAARRLAPTRHRLAMLELACAPHACLVADGSELRKTGASFTVDYLEDRAAAEADETRAWVIGSDAFADLLSWRRWRDVLALTNFLVFDRAGDGNDYSKALEQEIEARRVQQIDTNRHGQILLCDAELPEVSSTRIRRRVRAGCAVEHMLPSAVARYITEQELYGD